MLRRIKLYGPLAKFIGQRVLMADVATAAEAVRFLVANWPDVERHMGDHHYRITVGGDELEAGAQPEQLHYPVGRGEISIIPVVAGAGAAARIIAGVALVALAFAGPAGFFGAAFAKNALLFQVAGAVGFSLALGGVAQLLTPVPQTQKDEADPRKSFSFSGIQNVSRPGVPVPIIYGEVLVGSVVISAGIDITQVSA
jgi:predicted phage tail protein